MKKISKNYPFLTEKFEKSGEKSGKNRVESGKPDSKEESGSLNDLKDLKNPYPERKKIRNIEYIAILR